MQPNTQNVAATGDSHGLVERRLDGTQILVGVFEEQRSVERAINMLQAGGFDPQHVSVVVKDKATADRITGMADAHSEQTSRAAEPEPERMVGQVEVDKVSSASAGTAVGLSAGAAAGAALGLAAMAIPGVGPIMAAGPIAHALMGASVGAGAGAWAGSLTGMGIASNDADSYAGNLDEGRWLVAVRTDRVDETVGILRNAGALNF